MGDDLSNTWGTDLCIITKSDVREYKGDSIELALDEFKRLVAKHFKQEFCLQRVEKDGSTANLIAILDATNCDTSACLIAAGSYISADDTFLQYLSTSQFHLSYALSLIEPPGDQHDGFPKRQIVGLPYAIDGCLKKADLEKYEDKCLRSLHTKCLLMRANGCPPKALFFELMLAGNGASLSNRALEKIAELSKKHGFSLIIDEIMTGARTGTMLMLEQKPMEFVKCVSHVTMGKWVHVGLVLKSAICIHSRTKPIINKTKRSVTRNDRKNLTFIDVTPIIPIWKKIVTLLPNSELRRQLVLKKLRCNEKDSWGQGCLIFAPSRNNTTKNLKCRYLPLLELVHIDTLTLNSKEAVNKHYTNQLVVDACNDWKDVIDSIVEDQFDDYYSLLLLKTLSVRSIIEGNEVFTLEEIHRDCFNGEINKKQVACILKKLQLAGLIDRAMLTAKRLRKWIITDDIRF